MWYDKRDTKQKGTKEMLRRLAAAVIILMLLVSFASAEGELRGYSAEEGYVYVLFGNYPQTIDGGIPDDGQQTVKWRSEYQKAKKDKKKTPIDTSALEPEPILWRVLAADDERVYLLSEFILFSAPLHHSGKEFKKFKGDFTKTDLWAMLNGEFAQTAFTEAEFAMLKDNAELGRVFIPSGEEVSDPALGFAADIRKKVQVTENDGRVTNDYHSTNEPRKAWATEYAIKVTGTYVYPYQRRNHSPYWLRDPVSKKANQSHGRNIKNFGQIGTYDCTNPEEGARPGVFLNPAAYRIESGSGTREDPYRLAPAESAE